MARCHGISKSLTRVFTRQLDQDLMLIMADGALLLLPIGSRARSKDLTIIQVLFISNQMLPSDLPTLEVGTARTMTLYRGSFGSKEFLKCRSDQAACKSKFLHPHIQKPASCKHEAYQIAYLIVTPGRVGGEVVCHISGDPRPPVHGVWPIKSSSPGIRRLGRPRDLLDVTPIYPAARLREIPPMK